MPVTQSTCTSNFPPNPNSAVPLPPYSLSCSALSSAASTFFTRSKNPIFKSNSAPFLRAKPQRGARLIASAAGTDYYKTLNVLRTATLQEIKSAYRKVSTCSKCGGDGIIITDPCQRCSGDGQVQSTRTTNVIIPVGVNDGSTMQIQAEGNFDKKRGKAGDVYIVLHVDEKAGIRRDGLNLYSKINIDYTEAILGTVVKVETVEGLKELQIPLGIQPGEIVKLRRMGVPDINRPSARGDHHFTVNVLTPKIISDKECALVEELASLKSSREGHSAAPKGTGIRDGNFG